MQTSGFEKKQQKKHTVVYRPANGKTLPTVTVHLLVVLILIQGVSRTRKHIDGVVET